MPVRASIKSLAAKLRQFQRSDTKFIWILGAVFASIILHPFLPSEGWSSFIVQVLQSFVILSGIVVASNERQVLRQVTVIGLFIISLGWISSLAQQQFPSLVLLVYALYAGFIGFMTIAIILVIIKTPKVTGNIICGAVTGYLLIGLSGAFLALLVETLNPGAFLMSGELLPRAGLANHLIYYSMVSLSTIGYGDITPATPVARSLSLAIGLIGQIYLTVLVATLVGKFLKD